VSENPVSIFAFTFEHLYRYDTQRIMMDVLDIVDSHTSGVAYPTVGLCTFKQVDT
jgi:hypothetical protein